MISNLVWWANWKFQFRFLNVIECLMAIASIKWSFIAFYWVLINICFENCRHRTDLLTKILHFMYALLSIRNDLLNIISYLKYRWRKKMQIHLCETECIRLYSSIFMNLNRDTISINFGCIVGMMHKIMHCHIYLNNVQNTCVTKHWVFQYKFRILVGNLQLVTYC